MTVGEISMRDQCMTVGEISMRDQCMTVGEIIMRDQCMTAGEISAKTKQYWDRVVLEQSRKGLSSTAIEQY